ncbi:5'-nucleotidase domain-containing protein 3 [Lepeophtheirus salmonis]|uniref:5'-nucleotidase domain-containing protein 3 n=1 Tax=Lepeophtheirus salmonis TaxID=72036 RepID=A0A7R8CY37_LEPSM|nr:5'-nucleotidase domain-containing protein 3 [Lepeophtheirus salmonis]CAF2966656.1 5'-nucleotidase domain-containing protein 3 [Lepeophtheirus salmonis]
MGAGASPTAIPTTSCQEHYLLQNSFLIAFLRPSGSCTFLSTGSISLYLSLCGLLVVLEYLAFFNMIDTKEIMREKRILVNNDVGRGRLSHRNCGFEGGLFIGVRSLVWFVCMRSLFWLHGTFVENPEYAGYIIPPPPPSPNFDASKDKLRKLGDAEGCLTKEEFDKMKQELEAEYLACFKKTRWPCMRPFYAASQSTITLAYNFNKLSDGVKLIGSSESDGLSSFLMKLSDTLEKMYRVEARVASDEDLKLTNKNLDKARARNKDLEQVENEQQECFDTFNNISAKAKEELGILKTRRISSFQKSLVELADRSYLLEKYEKSRIFIEGKGLPPDVNRHSVFANDYLDLSDIEIYGFDYDYTLTNYKKSVEIFLYNSAKKDLIERLKYPKEFENFHYDDKYCIRGLHFDIEHGLLLKVDSFHQIQLGSVYKGRRQLADEEVLRIYQRRHVPLKMIEERHHRKPRMSQMMDIFAKPFMCLLADVIHWFSEKGIEYEPYSIHHDVWSSVQTSHPAFHKECVKYPEIYLEEFPELSSFLENLIDQNKQIFLITNSTFDLVNAGMSFMIGKDWKSLEFDPVKKILLYDKVWKLLPNKVYSGGNLHTIQKMMKWEGSKVLYFGDHPYSDLEDLTLHHGWRTAAIIRELEDEIDTINKEEFKKYQNWSITLQSLIENNQMYLSEDCKDVITSWVHELNDITLKMKKMSNPYFGSIFRTHVSPTAFSRNLFRFADIYTSKLINMSPYSTDHVFYPRRGALPHEFRHWTG